MERERVILSNVSKKFRIGCKEENKSALARVVSLFSGKEQKRDFFALKNVSFSLASGQNLGIIGRNGSGKSTLLRVIAGVYGPDEGEVKTKGSLVLLTGIGQGLNPKLTMRENIYLMGSILGLGQRDIKKKFNEIVEFAGLLDFIDTKVYQFSSGMLTRLNFSVMIHCIKHSNPDILLLDEVFRAGGDIDFESKATKKMEEFVSGGTTVVLATHDLDIVKKYCDKVIWIEKGRIAIEGRSSEVVEKYIKESNYF
jgi:ABC-type polysaccharide/polyol phosphate transport system ATPase subunit